MSIIDFVTNPFTGGGPRNIYTISNLLNQAGFDSSVLFFNDISTNKKSRVISEQFNVKIKMPSNFLGNLNRILSISDEVNFFKMPLFLLQEYLTRPLSISYHKSADAYISTFWQSVIPTSKVTQRLKGVHLYFVQADETIFSSNSIYKKLAEKSYKTNISKFTHSMWIKEHLDSKFGGENTYIGMGINHDTFRVRNLAKEQVIFTIARGDPNKGFEVFVNAMNELIKTHPDLKIKIAGEQDIINKMKKGGLIKFPFEFLGWLNNDEELSKLYETSIFVNTGNFEALPMPPLEAMASGSSVVMTDMIGAKEFAKDGVNSLLCPAGDFKCFASKIESILHDDTQRGIYSKEGVRTVKRYRWEFVIARLTQLFEEHDI